MRASMAEEEADGGGPSAPTGAARLDDVLAGSPSALRLGFTMRRARYRPGGVQGPTGGTAAQSRRNGRISA